MQDKGNWHEFIKGLYRENPIFVGLLGLCPALAVTTQTINGITMGIATTFVLLGSNTIISLLKNYIPDNLRIPSYIVVIATFVTLIKIFLAAFSPDVNEALGIFIPLIVVNCIILGRAEAFASNNTLLKSVLDAIGMGLGFTITLTVVAFVREVFGAGQITLKIADWGKVYDLKGIYEFLGLVDTAGEKAPLTVLLLPPGAFIILGLLLGGMNFLQVRIKNRLLVLKQKKLLSDQNKPLND